MADQPKPEWDVATHGPIHPDLAPAYTVVDSSTSGQAVRAKALADANQGVTEGAPGQAAPTTA